MRVPKENDEEAARVYVHTKNFFLFCLSLSLSLTHSSHALTYCSMRFKSDIDMC